VLCTPWTAMSGLFSGSRSCSPSTMTQVDAAGVSVPERARLALDMQHFFDSTQLSDVRLQIETSTGSFSMHAHRLVLVASSTYFASAFSEAWEPSVQEPANPRTLLLRSDEHLVHVRRFIEFLYGREVELTLACAHPLLRLADFYGVDKLADSCLNYLERVLHPEPTRCFQLFVPLEASALPELASTEGVVGGGDTSRPLPILPPPPAQPKLLALCTEVLARSFSDVSAHESFLSCPTELLYSVLERDDLSVDREHEVLSALLGWAAHEPEGRTPALGDLLPLIRWPMIDGETLADIEDSHELLRSEPARAPLRDLLLDAFKYQAASSPRKGSIMRGVEADAARRFRPRTPNMVRLQGEGKFCWSLKNFSRLHSDERIYSPPFCFSGIAFMLLFFPRGNQQREYVSLYVSVADKTKLQPGWRREVHFSLCVIDQNESLCSVTKSTHGELSNTVLDWGFTELMPLATLHSPNHGYILDDTLQFTIQFERVTEGSVSGAGQRPPSNSAAVRANGFIAF